MHAYHRECGFPPNTILGNSELPVWGILGNLLQLCWRASIRSRTRRWRLHWALCWSRVAHHSSHHLPPLGKSCVAIDNGANLYVNVVYERILSHYLVKYDFIRCVDDHDCARAARKEFKRL